MKSFSFVFMLAGSISLYTTSCDNYPKIDSIPMVSDGVAVTEGTLFYESLVALSTEESPIFCSGVLVSTDKILTTATCVSQFLSTQIYAIFANNTEYRKIVNIDFNLKFPPHSSALNMDSIANNTATLTLNSAAPSWTTPVEIFDGLIEVGKKAFVAGYGNYFIDGIPRMGSVTIDRVNSGVFMISSSANELLCNSDGGGPIVLMKSDGTPALIGVVSTGFPIPGTPRCGWKHISPNLTGLEL